MAARIVIVGAGAAGTAIANRLVRRLEGASIPLLDARAEHLSRPGLSLAAAGLKPASCVVSRTANRLPSRVTLVAGRAAAIDPVAKTVATEGGQRLDHDFLIVAPGQVRDRDAIGGFSRDLVGRDGIGALYAGPGCAARTREAVRRFTEEGGTALMTRPATGMKSAGSPFEHAFLVEDIASRTVGQGNYEIHHTAPQAALFSVPIVAGKVRMPFGERGIATDLAHTLKAVDPGRRIATSVQVGKGAEEAETRTEVWNGHTSCPLITRVGRATLVERDHGNKLEPSFPGVIAPLGEPWISWPMKEVARKATCNAMLRGKA